MTVDLYDLLGVAPDAGHDEIRAAWREATADLGPGDRMFRVYNQAAEVLLDPRRRAQHDAELAAEDPGDDLGADEPEAGATFADPDHAAWASTVAPPGAPDPMPELEAEPDPEPEPDPAPDPATTTAVVEDEPRGAPRPAIPTWVVAAVALVTAVVVAVTAWQWIDRGEQATTAGGDQDVTAAVVAAEEAVVPVLSFDYRDLDQGIVEAQSYMTTDYAVEHSRLLDDLRSDIEAQQSVVDAEAMGAGLVRTGEDRADVLVLVNQVTTRADEEPFLLPVWATLQMRYEDDEWKVSGLVNRGTVAE